MQEQQVNTMAKEWYTKVVLLQNNPNLKESLKKYFLQTYSVYEKLFELLASQKAFYIRAEPLRHPLIFYYGHTAAAYMNKMMEQGLITERINKKYQTMLAIGVDERDWDDLNEEHYDWPTVEEVKQFRVKVKQVIIKALENCKTTTIDNWNSDLWAFLVGIEHERLHLETSSVIIRQVPIHLIKPVPQLVQCQQCTLQTENIPKNSMAEVTAWKDTWNNSTTEHPPVYGWDNQFGERQFNVKPFKASRMLVSNGEYLEFINDKGYHNTKWWTEEGKRWLRSKATMPRFWRKKQGKYMLRTMSRQIDMPWDWPVETNNLEARAFCKWKSEKSGKYTRLLTQDQYYAVRNMAIPSKEPNWQPKTMGNINLEYWMSPNPVNLFKKGQFYDVVGNVWQHTVTPQYPLKNFKIHHLWDDFTTPQFHDDHDLLKGGSFVSTGGSALYQFRVAFRRHFYQFAGFRYAQDCDEIEVDTHPQNIAYDNELQLNLQHQYFNEKSYVMEVVRKVNTIVGEKKVPQKMLTVGCSVGRMPLEFGKLFQKSVGIDYTTRYFEMSTELKKTGLYNLQNIHIDLKKMGLSTENVGFIQSNPENPDQAKINGYDWVLIDGFSLRKGKISTVLTQALKLVKSKANILLLSVSELNQLTSHEGEMILSQALNGGKVWVKEDIELSASQEDQSYLPKKEDELCFHLIHYEISQ